MIELVDVKYISASGVEVDFQIAPLKIKEANFHNWGYKVEEQALKVGVKPTRIYKDPVTYSTTLYMNGSPNNKRHGFEWMHTVFERDVRAMTPGKLIYNNWWIRCFVTASDTYPNDGNVTASNDLQFYCPYPYWIKEETFTYNAATIAASEYLDYTYDYEYDFMKDAVEVDGIENEGTGFAPMIIRFFGTATNPFVRIAGIDYLVNYTINPGEVIEINQLDKTVILTRANGDIVNLFDYRQKYEDHSVFDPVPIGIQPVEWGGDYKVTVTLCHERSEPGWS